MTKTQFNRRVAVTLVLYLGAQSVLAAGAWAAGITPELTLSVLVFAWAITETLLAVWVEPWFGLSAGVALASFILSAWWPKSALPLMSLDSVVLTLVVLLAWFPRQDLARMREERAILRRRAPAWLSGTPAPPHGQPGGRGVPPQPD